MNSSSESAKVAVYWDFENLHAVLVDQEHGDGAYRENPFQPQPAIVKLSPIINYAASFGDVVIHRAYGNWQWFHQYRYVLNEAGVDLIQMFPRGKFGRNSADIRLALDALGDIHIHPHISHVVIVSSDSDFISLAQKVKQAGKFIAGVGIRGFSNKFWMASCNEFKFYDTLVTLAEPGSPSATQPDRKPGDAGTVATLSLAEARDALAKAMTQLVARNGENYIARSGLKIFMKRLLPSFDEQALGCETFGGFLSRFPELVTLVDSINGGHVALVNYTEPVREPDIAPDPEDADPNGAPGEASESTGAPAGQQESPALE